MILKLHHAAAFASIPLLLIGVFSSAHAARDWSVHENADAVLNVPVCRAVTTVAKLPPAANLAVELSVSVPKVDVVVPVVYVKITGLASPSATALIRFAKKDFQPMFLFQSAAGPQEPDIYWYAPRDLPRLIAHLRESDSLDLVFEPNAAPPLAARFSLAGAGAAIAQAAVCAKTTSLLPTEFLAVLNAKLPTTPPPTTAVSAMALQQLVQQAFVAYRDGKAAAPALAAVRRTMKPLVDRETNALRDLASKQNALDVATRNLSAKTQERQNTESAAATASAELKAAQADRPLALADFDAKKAAYDPLKAALAPYEKDVRNGRDRVDEAAAAVEADRNRISGDAAEITELRDRASDLDSEIATAQRDLPTADAALLQARINLNNFSLSQSKQRYLDQADYSSARSRAEGTARNASMLETQVTFLQNDVNIAQLQLANCQSKSGANCDTEESALGNARSLLQSKEREATDARSEADRARARAESIDQDAAARAESDRAAVQAAFDNATQHANDLRSRIASDQSELSGIENARIPRLQSDLADARGELPALQTAEADARRALTESAQALARQRQSIGFDSVEAAFIAARARVDADTSTITDRTTRLDRYQKAIAKLLPVIAQISAVVAKDSAVRDAAAAQLAPIQSQLAPQRQAESALVARIAAATVALGDARALYQADYAVLAR